MRRNVIRFLSFSALSMNKIISHRVCFVPQQLAVPLNQVASVQKRFAAHQVFTKKTVEERIMLVLNLYDKIDNGKLSLDSDFFNDLGLDSLDFVEIIMMLENEFAFEIPDGDSDRMRTPRDVYQYICDKNDVFD